MSTEPPSTKPPNTEPPNTQPPTKNSSDDSASADSNQDHPDKPVFICQQSDVVGREVKQFDLPPTSRGMPRNGILLRDNDGSLRAFINVCMHLPIPLSFTEEGFWNAEGTHLMCRTHGALYRPDDGYCTEGPCEGMTLESLAIEINDDGSVRVRLEET